MKFKINDFVRILPENHDTHWYTEEIFQILGIIENTQVYIISINLHTYLKNKNRIFEGSVYQDSECKKRMRKLKLEQLENNVNNIEIDF